MPTVVPSQVVAFIEQRLPFAKERTDFALAKDYAGIVRATTELVEEVPPHLVTVDANDYALLREALADMRRATELWSGADRNHTLGPLQGRDKLHPLAAVRHVMLKCPDEAPAPGTADLTFIGDADLRQSLRLDVSAVSQALANGEWKAATVLGGSVVEALLLWAIDDLERRATGSVATAIAAALGAGTLKKSPNANRNRWDLAELVPVAREAGLIKAEAAQHCDLARGFRNLIHPGRAQRLGQSCDRATALSAAAAVEHVVRDLTP